MEGKIKRLSLVKNHKLVTRRILAHWLRGAIESRLDEEVMWPLVCLSYFDPLFAGQYMPSWHKQPGPIILGRKRKAIESWVKAWAATANRAEGLQAADLGCNTGADDVVPGISEAGARPLEGDAQAPPTPALPPEVPVQVEGPATQDTKDSKERHRAEYHKALAGPMLKSTAE